ncbi:amidohydrolase family protein [Membranihabitans maritimus]|uniref:amidohydrolase family protein n=1 Tax=Membranihabitans maritimus TaxID=2904244 RepID=UPI001F254AA9|nr:amidohydrolase family protein [Membranihabitans maritimus]
MKKLIYFFLFLSPLFLKAQETFPENGAPHEKEGHFAFTNGEIHINSDQVIKDGILIIKNGKIVDVGDDLTIPASAIKINLRGMHVYPSFIDLQTSFGIPPAPSPHRPSKEQLLSSKKGPYSWNESIIPEYRSQDEFIFDENQAKKWRNIGFGTVLSHRRNGVVRGSGLLTTLDNSRPHLSILNPLASSHLAFSKGASNQTYPTSLMGMIALIRQLYLDGEWYKIQGNEKETNLSLQAWNELQNLPQIFEVGNKLEVLRAAKIAKEYNKIYIIKGNGTEYQRADAIKKTGMPLIVPVDFPEPYDVEDPLNADLVSLEMMKHWEWAPSNPGILEEKEISFAITSAGLKEEKKFLTNIRTAILNGLSEKTALDALTILPAKWLGEEDRLGQLQQGFLANFFISDHPIWDEEAQIIENWIQGNQYKVQDRPNPIVGNSYNLLIGENSYEFTVPEKGEKIKLIDEDSASLTGEISMEFNRVNIIYSTPQNEYIRLSGIAKGDRIEGDALLPSSESVNFVATLQKDNKSEKVKERTESPESDKTPLLYPFTAYGRQEIPEQKTYLITNVTVWTNESESILENTDVLVQDGKIKDIGSIRKPRKAVEIDGTGMHLTPGIIDEHSHIAISRGVNEASQASSAEVRIGDVINSEDINIYRQLAGGVTTSQLLHGSANPIGGQSTLIKLRWGMTPEELKFEGADSFIKFALGENVKQSNWGERNTVRFPQTRMGVEQVYEDYFTRAREYGENKNGTKPYRKNLELECLLEILKSERFITCHSYVQSEINMLMHVAEKFGFRVNTFTHILEGYKVADKMEKHGAAGSTFSDWWAYKYEVIDAIPYNAAIMNKAGVNTSLNSDDAEMARRLNSEAGKTVKYGGLSDVEALKLVTLNPAKMLHIDDRVGSIGIGKDADIVLWNGPPLSNFSRAEKTFIDGRIYFDREENEKKAQQIKEERARLIQKMLQAKKGGKNVQKPQLKKQKEYHCETIGE